MPKGSNPVLSQIVDSLMLSNSFETLNALNYVFNEPFTTVIVKNKPYTKSEFNSSSKIS